MPRIDIPMQPKQAQVLEWAESDWSGWIGIGGGRGAAKSRGADSVALTCSFSEKAIVSCIVMRNFDQVRKYHIEPTLRTWPQLQDSFKVSSSKLTLPSTNSEIDYSYAENLADVERRFRSANYKYIIVDQAEQFVEQELREMKNACRWPGGGAKMILLFNMGGAGIQTLRKWFHTKEYHEHEDPKDFRFLHVYPWDNVEWSRAALVGDGLAEDDYYDWTDAERFEYFTTRSDYGKSLNSLDDVLRNRDLLGSWESLEGAYFGRVFDRQATMIDATQVSKILKPWSIRWLSQDWGKSHYCATLWHGIQTLSPSEVYEALGWEVSQPLRCVVTYRRKIVNELDSSEVAQAIVEATPLAERKLIKQFWLSPDAFGERDSSNTIATNQGRELRLAGLPEPEPADTDRAGGWTLMYELLQNTKAKGKAGDLVWLISAECPELLESIPVLMRDPKDLDVVLKTDKGQAKLEQDVSEACFAAGTPVITRRGEIGIEYVKVDDEVLTRKGWRCVKHSWKSRSDAHIVKAAFSDGTVIFCTPNHKFWTQRGFIPIESVRYGDKLISCEQFNLTEKHLPNVQTDILVAVGGSFIGKYGSSTMGQFPEECTSTIGTGHLKIQPESMTLNALRQNNMLGFTPKPENGPQKSKSKDSSMRQENGISLMRAGESIGSMPKVKSQSALLKTASNAAVSIKELLGRGFVRRRVRQNGDGTITSITSKSSVSSAEIQYCGIDSQTSKLAAFNAVRLCGLETAGFADVYDLEIEGEHEFFAGGILVHNCRYGLKSYLRSAKTPISELKKEVASQFVEDGVIVDPTELAMAMRRFESEHRKKAVRRTRWAVR